jgi:DNA-directed RNA polymerase specialized sigma24 family protein
MQEVSVVMWREHANFELGTNFVGWLSVIAYHQVQKFWRQRRKSESYLDAAVIEQLATTFQQDIEAVDIRRHFLNECLQALGRRDRAMIESVYNHSQNRIREVAQEFGQEESRFYRALAKIRRGLLGCVQRKMIAEGISL